MDFIPMRNPPAFADMAQLEADKQEYLRKQQLAQALIGSGYVPNSGRTGVLTAVLSALAGGMMQRKNNESVTDLMRRTFEQQSQAAAAKRQQELEDEQRKVENAIKEATGKKRGELTAERDLGKREIAGGMFVNPFTGQAEAIPGYMDQQLALKRGEAQIAAAGRQDPNAGLLSKIQLARSLGATDDQIRSMVTGQSNTQGVPSGYRYKEGGTLEAIPGGPADPNAPARPTPLTAEAKTKLSLIDNALANARKFQERVVGPNGEFKDIESMKGDTPQLMRSAIQDMLYAKSGASAPVEEVRKAEAMYGPSRALGGLIPTERDSTAAAKVGNFITDLQRMRDEIGSTTGQQPAQGGNGAPQQQGANGGNGTAPAAQPTMTAVNPQTGQRLGLVNGNWVPL